MKLPCEINAQNLCMSLKIKFKLKLQTKAFIRYDKMKKYYI